MTILAHSISTHRKVPQQFFAENKIKDDCFILSWLNLFLLIRVFCLYGSHTTKKSIVRPQFWQLIGCSFYIFIYTQRVINKIIHTHSYSFCFSNNNKSKGNIVCNYRAVNFLSTQRQPTQKMKKNYPQFMIYFF